MIKTTIPLDSLIQPSNQPPIDSKNLLCQLCNNILYEPIIFDKDNLFYCLNCFIEKQLNINKDFGEIQLNKIIEKKQILNQYKYKCPICKYFAFSYDELLSHMIICENKECICGFCNSKLELKSYENKDEIKKNLIENFEYEREYFYELVKLGKYYKNYVEFEKQLKNINGKEKLKNDSKKNIIGKKRNRNMNKSVCLSPKKIIEFSNKKRK